MNAQPSALELALAKIAALEAQITAQATAKITLKVGEKGTVCLYHGSRYPIALYAEQWERLLPFFKSGQLDAFMTANATLLSRRDDKA